jgi:hypothetical protein
MAGRNKAGVDLSLEVAVVELLSDGRRAGFPTLE